MRLGVLYSGGKDSTLALMKAQQFHDVLCLVTLVSSNKESFMFHTPNIDITSLQAEAMELPLVRVETLGEKENELADLKKALTLAKKQHKIETIEFRGKSNLALLLFWDYHYLVINFLKYYVGKNFKRRI